ncbi:cell division protein FtsL [Phenylobacterium deserti]|uniref:Cell division protein n=1 Tax=Phenylobacterium deserti TaxID=1914756 RepID=A0A328A9C7_9CAUL|nr:cell division protein [Phenylobacterium deserti]RAK51293.1 cell division protein [Phenylobacterium deserti]
MSLLDRKVRGFRLVDLLALGLLVVLILGVYLAKTMAGRERAQIAQVERQIAAEKARIRLLQAEVSHLEQPARIERLSTAYLGLKPVTVKREAKVEALPAIAAPAPPPKPSTKPEEAPAPKLDPTLVAEAPEPVPGNGQ